MVRTVWFFMSLVFSLIVTGLIIPFWHFLGLLGLSDVQKKLSHYTSYFWARFLIAMAGMKVRVSGLENVPPDKAVLFVSNHQSNFDIPVLLGYINKSKGFLAKIELTKLPVIHSWMKKMGCVFINRSDRRQSLKAIHQCIEVIKSGQSMVIFPEGTRSRGPVMRAFKKGSLRVAEKVRVPIIPIVINGTYKLMEANNNKIKSSDVEIKILRPVYYDQLPAAEKGKLNDYIREMIIKNL